MSESIEHDFWQFHRQNPQVYARLIGLARDLKAKGHTRLGIGMLFEVVRWQHMLLTHDPASEFKLNNNYRSHYARLIMLREEDLAGVFETRHLHRESTLEVQAEVTPSAPAPVTSPDDWPDWRPRPTGDPEPTREPGAMF